MTPTYPLVPSVLAERVPTYVDAHALASWEEAYPRWPVNNYQ